MNEDVKALLKGVQDGSISVEQAMHQLKTEPFRDIGYAKLDTHRALRTGVGEVIYGAGKTAEQISGIVGSLLESGQERILITRISPEKAAEVEKIHTMTYHADASLAIIGGIPQPDGKGTIVVATGGTSDIPVAEEAALTAEFMGNKVKRLYDVGVAGLHRTLAHLDDIVDANVVIAIAGMEGALASVLGGLAECPVLAVPTSVGYGASFGGISALLSMLNSCASGVSVVNIDNGFGAGYQASLINHR
ncbi:MAG: nickel pincer cofactor biosynthesis protein LarB [Lachnospiraceae bacterium]|nr:nickel pincer cofactor biosynthesis protein LarB [Lachnospiraceae bacterium]